MRYPSSQHRDRIGRDVLILLVSCALHACSSARPPQTGSVSKPLPVAAPRSPGDESIPSPTDPFAPCREHYDRVPLDAARTYVHERAHGSRSIFTLMPDGVGEFRGECAPGTPCNETPTLGCWGIRKEAQPGPTASYGLIESLSDGGVGTGFGFRLPNPRELVWTMKSCGKPPCVFTHTLRPQ